ncbi:MAG: DMT family transporter [Firmicutes bacterium]|nr:DMT family transporter [Bacillota bacterium]
MEDRTKGIVLILFSAFFFALMAATVKSLARIPVAEKIFFRNIFGLFIATYMIVKNKKPILGNNKKFLLLRGIFGMLGMSAYFYALGNMPLADTVILNKMSPFFVMVFSAIFLKEKIKKYQLLSLILAVFGAIFVIKPQFDVTIIPYIIALLSAIFAGSAYTTIRHLRHTDSSETIVFYFTFISTVSMIPFLFNGQFIIPSLKELLGLLALGTVATSAQFLMTNAYRFAPAGELAIYTYTNIVFSTIIGLLIWSEIPDILSIIGGLSIITAGFINYYSNKKGKLKVK